MKKILTVLTLLTSCFIMASCSNSNKTPDNSENTSQGITETETTGEQESKEIETRIFSTVKGDIEIPVKPQKIVTDYYLGEFLALGVKPVIASPYSLSNEFLSEYVDGIEELNIASSETALEMISETQPDLIVTLSEADYDNFSKIAPTVLIPYDTYSPEELFSYIADMVGEKEKAVEYRKAFTEKAESVKSEILEIVDNRTISFVEIWPGEVYVFGSHFGRGGSILFDIWGLKAPEKVQTAMVEGDKVYDTVSLEALPQYAGDFVFYGVLAGADSGFVEQSSVWKNIPAVKNGLFNKYQQVSFMHSDPITLGAQLDYYIDYFRSVK